MRYNPDIHHRRSIRLPAYDYSRPGAYFITLCTAQRDCLFGQITDGRILLNAFGEIVRAEWHRLPRHYDHVSLDGFVVMPNHVHGVVWLADVGAGLEPSPALPHSTDGVLVASPTLGPSITRPYHTPAPARRHALPEIVRFFKTFSARRVNALRKSPGVPVWQRNYYERIIRDETELNRIRHYIKDNPSKWIDDPEHPGEPPNLPNKLQLHA